MGRREFQRRRASDAASQAVSEENTSEKVSEPKNGIVTSASTMNTSQPFVTTILLQIGVEHKHFLKM
jgi:hypothetical protein